MTQRWILIGIVFFAISLSSVSSTAATKPLPETGLQHTADDRNLPNNAACDASTAAWGTAASRDIECDDQSIALVAFSNSVNGDVGQSYAWAHAGHYGTFAVTREYSNGSHTCRDFHGVSYRDGYRFVDDGSVCKLDDGLWHPR
jgi:surface antigen